MIHGGEQILDVGGRRSPYTVGLAARITIIDLPRESEVQSQLGLGVNELVLTQIRQRRSNIENVILGDMTKCTLPSASFDGVISIEVIEHIPDDETFVAQLARVLKPGGWVYLTTPNGDGIPNTNPDHVRHYKREQLTNLLSRHFDEVRVTYGIATSKNRLRGLQALDPRRPLRSLESIVANFRNRRESQGVEEHARRTAHLFAVARNPPRPHTQVS
jgi:SAM-dependent methyltransferase